MKKIWILTRRKTPLKPPFQRKKTLFGESEGGEGEEEEAGEEEPKKVMNE